MNQIGRQQMGKSLRDVRPAFLRSTAVALAALFGAAYVLLHTPAVRAFLSPLSPTIFLFLREKWGNCHAWYETLTTLLAWACLVAFPFAACVAGYDFVLLRRKHINH